jgi:hypothetical protein
MGTRLHDLAELHLTIGLADHIKTIPIPVDYHKEEWCSHRRPGLPQKSGSVLVGDRID